MPSPASRIRFRSRRHAVTAACSYLVFGVVWILFSDALINALSDDIDVLSRLQSAKGSLFVAMSAVAIYVLVRFQR